MVKVSVIVPIYNAEKYLPKCLDSLINQTFEDMEIICINDGSTDKSLSCMDDYEKRDERIKVISQENRGPGASRNTALEIAQGDYIMYLDADDWLSPDAVETAYSEITKHDADLTFFQMINYDDTTHETYPNDWFDLKQFDESFDDRSFGPSETPGSIFDLSVGVCQKIYSHKFLKRIDAKFPEGIFFEDMPFFYYVYLKAERISIVKRHLYYRRKHDESITHVVDCKFLDTVPAGQILIDIFIENDWYDTYKFDLLAYKINGPRFALRDIEEKCKVPLYKLIKKDYLSIKSSDYFDDYLENLGPVKKRFLLDIIESKDYEDYLKLQEIRK